jgi:hypothetical protein
MKKINFRLLLIVVCAGLIVSLALGEAFARSRGGFGGFKSSRSFSSSKSFSKSSWGKTTKSGLSSSKRKSSAGKMSSADRSQYNRAKSSGTVFNSKSDALKSFKSKNASKYPTKFGSKPATRPDYIPASFKADGKSYNVGYRNGGYGYMAGSMWRPYSPFSDPFMAARLMGMGGYYYGPRPGLSFMAVMGMGITLFALFVILKSFVASMGSGQGGGQGTRKFKSL